MITPVILAGGSGTRLWPLSRELYPKQLISLVNENTMLENTLLRLNSVDTVSPPLVVCNDEHRFMAAEQMRRTDGVSGSILLEPVGRNTAPAIAAAALFLLKQEKDPVLLVLPADHVINNTDNFHQALKSGEPYAEKGFLITFGIIPDAPETGYGYIQKGKAVDVESSIFEISRFVEKPDSETAKEYVRSKKFCWNSGMFMFKASIILAELERYVPDIVSACRNALEKGISDLDFFRLDRDAFGHSPSESIDYAVMEKTDKGLMIPFDAGWNDLGSWDALYQSGEKDEQENVVKGDVLLSDVKHSYLHSQSRLIAAVGIEDCVVVETVDAVLVAARHRVQDVKKIVTRLKELKRNEAVCHRKVYRPWGSYENVDISQRFQVKRIIVKPRAKLSLQKHYHRAEHWTVVSGTGLITRDKDEILLKEDESVYIPLGVMHRIENPGTIPLEIIEIQSGSYLGEDDIVRFDDVYGRKDR
ncbi:MAG: mannose-1-phosphate guanylyltransferase/mannose-6-phosphate isomerase [Thermodesulfobacteriota bacterium]|nr:mannose-1-phosphate guanylyltransferase/mannose-6-phosphate isomerase [Thermodesulfobacteriota bacterium]